MNRNESEIIENIEDRVILKKLLDMVERKKPERVVDIEKDKLGWALPNFGWAGGKTDLAGLKINCCLQVL